MTIREERPEDIPAIQSYMVSFSSKAATQGRPYRKTNTILTG
jgi:hypothetical protein